MYTKAVFVIIDVLAIIVLALMTHSTSKVKEYYAVWLKYAFVSSLIACLANILIAVSFNATVATIAFSLYYGTIDWILFYFSGFTLEYTEHSELLKRFKTPAAVFIFCDSISFVFEILFHQHFNVYTTTNADGYVFYQTQPRPLFYVHLIVCYITLFIALVFLITKISSTYSFYQTRYILILMVLMLIVVINIFYMMMGLLLDASVLFYAIGATVVYYCVQIYVPRSLLNVALESAVFDMHEGLILFDIYGNCIYVNNFAKERFEINIDNFKLSSEPVHTVLKSLSQMGNTYGQTDYRRKVLHNGTVSEETYRIRYSELSDEKERIIGSYFLMEDTTEETYYLEEIKEARVNADNANLAKSTFLASMSHEIRTPLNSVLGMNEMILRSTDDPTLIEYAENIKSSGDILLSLINDILDFSKIEAGKMELIYAAYSPHKLLKDCYNSFYQMAEGKELCLKFECAEDIPSLLQGDERRLRQVFSNIISNAIKYTKKGGVTVSVTSEPLDEENIYMVARIRDTGIGISEEDIKYLFDSFRRVNEEENATIQGTGLGLSITKQMIGLMNGSIDVSSAVGEGSCFTIRIPQKILSFSPAGPLKMHETVEEHKYKETFKAPTAEILVVDDVAVNLKVVEALLRRTEIKIDKATGGYEAISKCDHKKYDLILLDHRMPEPDGVETFKQISKNGLNTTTPVIVLTANALSGAEEEYRKIGFADYLSKPIKSNELELTILRHLPIDKVEIV